MKNKYFLILIILTSFLFGSCEKQPESITLFSENTFENISNDPFLEFEKGYKKLVNDKSEAICKEDNSNKIFVTDDSLSIMYWLYNNGEYKIQTVTAIQKSDKFYLSKLIGMKKDKIETVITNKIFSNTEQEIDYVSDDWIYFANFYFDSEGKVDKIILGLNL